MPRAPTYSSSQLSVATWARSHAPRRICPAPRAERDFLNAWVQRCADEEDGQIDYAHFVTLVQAEQDV